jgi:hypothetical protein
MNKKATILLLAVLVVCLVFPGAVTAEKGREEAGSGKSKLSSNIKKKHEKKYKVYEFRAKSSAYELFVLQRKLDYIRNKIRTAYEWIPRLAIEEPEIDPKKVLLDLRKQQSTLEKKANIYAEEVTKDKLIFQKPYKKKGTMLKRYRDALADILLQSGIQRESGLTAECPSDFYMYSSVGATEFKEYKTTTKPEGTNTDSNWVFRRGFFMESPIIDADTLRFDAYAFPIPRLGLDQANSIWTAGLLKFNFPVAPCDVVIEWNAVVNIDFILGARIDGEDDGIMVDLVLREQPNSTSFPDVELDDPGFEWVDWGDLDFCDPDAPGCPGEPNWQRRTKRERLSGQFQVDSGMTSSLIIGPSLNVLGWSEWASIGRMDNQVDDGAFFFHGIADDCYYGTPCGNQDLSIEFLMRPR